MRTFWQMMPFLSLSHIPIEEICDSREKVVLKISFLHETGDPERNLNAEVKDIFCWVLDL